MHMNLVKLSTIATIFMFSTASVVQADEPLAAQLKENSLAIAIAILIYLLPSWIAWQRKHHNKGPITILNVLAGWTIIGWVFALVWAVAAVRKNEPIIVVPPAADTSKTPARSVTERITELKTLLDSGAITQDEFDALKRRAIENS